MERKIVSMLKKLPSIKTSDVADKLHVSRVYASRFLNRMVREGKLASVGKARATIYVLPHQKKFTSISNAFHRIYKNTNLKEDIVYKQIKNTLELSVKKRIEEILAYAFTEMLNNAIDHSKSQQIKVSFEIHPKDILFIVRDKGIGIFNNIRKKFQLKNNFEALQELLKGKKTTMPKKHTGEGIFFTSKIADKFIIKSYGLELIIDNLIDDYFVSEINNIKGTQIEFTISLHSKKYLNEVFQKFTDKNYQFSKTQITVELYKTSDNYVSRSEAKRILHNLDKYDSIILDFKNVSLVGQGFADEVFRIYKRTHPHIEILPINMTKPVSFMVFRSIAAYEAEK